MARSRLRLTPKPRPAPPPPAPALPIDVSPAADETTNYIDTDNVIGKDIAEFKPVVANPEGEFIDITATRAAPNSTRSRSLRDVRLGDPVLVRLDDTPSNGTTVFPAIVTRVWSHGDNEVINATAFPDLGNLLHVLSLSQIDPVAIADADIKIRGWYFPD